MDAVAEAGLDDRIARRVREGRLSLGLTLDELAERSGVSRAMISRVERGEASPTAVLLGRLANALQTTLSDFFREDGPGGPLVRAADHLSGAIPPPATSAATSRPMGPGLDIVDVTLPPGASVTYDNAVSAQAVDQVVWVLEGGSAWASATRSMILRKAIHWPCAWIGRRASRTSPRRSALRRRAEAAAEACEGIMSVRIRAIDPAEARRLLPGLAALLADAVAGGAGVNFMAGFTVGDAAAYWSRQIEGLASGDRVWIVAEAEGHVVGTVMCVFAPQPNQPFRADVAKMLVLSSHRGRGLGAALLAAIEAEALKAGKTLLILDTTAGSAADRLYRRCGWTPFGTAPGYAYAPDGKLDDATFFYKQLAPTPVWKGRS